MLIHVLVPMELMTSQFFIEDFYGFGQLVLYSFLDFGTSFKKSIFFIQKVDETGQSVSNIYS